MTFDLPRIEGVSQFFFFLHVQHDHMMRLTEVTIMATQLDPFVAQCTM